MERRKTELLPMVIALVLFALLGPGPFFFLSGSQERPIDEVRLEILNGIDRSYSGRYQNDPRLEALFSKLEKTRDQAQAATAEKTGLLIGNSSDFVIRFKDTELFSDFGASIQPLRLADGQVNLVTLSSRHFILGIMDVQASLVHEFIHGAMREMMGAERYYALPKWIREGIAVWGAGQLRERCLNLIAGAFIKKQDPQKLLCEFKLPKNPVDNYLMDAMLFEFISQNQGDQAVRNLLAEIMTGNDYTQAFEQVTGFDWAELSWRKERFANMYFEGVVFESGLGLFQQAQRLNQRGDRSGAIEQLVALTEGPYDRLLQPNAWYWLGRWYFQGNQFRRAADAFATILEEFPEYSGLQNDSQRWLE
ncbi:MAG: tetratricopeptide repeat protein, partial [Deltaproteobacteria bacterium]|nr:tetratricopeptide repeat protein [Deltaproteobacteria bacterium]